MVNSDLRDNLSEISENAVLFDNPSFDNSIIGVSTDGGVIYSLNLMVDELSKDDGITKEDALEFISFNTIRALPYVSDGVPPTIIEYEMEDLM